MFVDREGRVLRVCLTRDEKYRIFTPLDAMSAELREATLLYEDRAFWSHSGVSLPALVRAAWSTLSGERRMGASTLTMQVARMTGDIDSSRIPGKLRQIWRALVLERHYSKREILEAYLNLAPYGGNIKGAGAAARIYFSKEAAALSLPEVMALALVPQHPAARSPLSGRKEELDAARRRLHALWSEAHPGAGGRLFAESPLRVRGPRDLPSEAPHAVDSLLNGPDAVPTEAADGRNGVIVTTLDLNIQHMVEDALRRGVERGGRWGMRNAAALLVGLAHGRDTALPGRRILAMPPYPDRWTALRPRLLPPGSRSSPSCMRWRWSRGLSIPPPFWRIHPGFFAAMSRKTRRRVPGAAACGRGAAGQPQHSGHMAGGTPARAGIARFSAGCRSPLRAWRGSLRPGSCPRRSGNHHARACRTVCHASRSGALAQAVPAPGIRRLRRQGSAFSGGGVGHAGHAAPALAVRAGRGGFRRYSLRVEDGHVQRPARRLDSGCVRPLCAGCLGRQFRQFVQSRFHRPARRGAAVFLISRAAWSGGKACGISRFSPSYAEKKRPERAPGAGLRAYRGCALSPVRRTPPRIMLVHPRRVAHQGFRHSA